eukprot:347442-Chlamydomonas_euryale.AAC.1
MDAVNIVGASRGRHDQQRSAPLLALFLSRQALLDQQRSAPRSSPFLFRSGPARPAALRAPPRPLPFWSGSGHDHVSCARGRSYRWAFALGALWAFSELSLSLSGLSLCEPPLWDLVLLTPGAHCTHERQLVRETARKRDLIRETS